MPVKVPVHGLRAKSFSELHNTSLRPRSSPLLRTQCRSASILSFLSDNPSAYNKRIRVGRGPSSGYGKTSGRGHKGQGQHGKVPAGFEGGQTPIEIVHGKRGFKNVFTPELTTLPVSRIQSWIAQGRISPDRPITVRELVRSNCISMPKDGVKLLSSSLRHDGSLDAQPELTQPLHIVVSRASAAAIAAVEKAGGKVTTRYYTSWAIRKIVHGKMDPMKSLRTEPIPQVVDSATKEQPTSESLAPDAAEAIANLSIGERPPESMAYDYRLPDATSRKAIEYYRDPAHRGYLAYTVEEGHGPSLFFKPPIKSRKAVKGANAAIGNAKKPKMEDNRLW